MSLEKSFTKTISRRELFKESGKAALALGGGFTLDAIVTGCATVGFKETGPVIYPPLKDHKVQPPENGCLVGFYKYLFSDSRYEEKIGKNPSIFALFHYSSMVWGFFSIDEGPKRYAEKGSIPLIYAGTNDSKLKDIINGKEDRFIKRFARDAATFGEQHGGFFITTMWEMNGYWFPWGQHSKFKEAWKYIWQIFEENGANKYATWFWEVYCREVDSKIDYPERYYPGDEYVDWIGLSAFNRQMFSNTHQPYIGLVAQTYYDMRRNHPGKPIMHSELGKTKMNDQARWLKNAYNTIRKLPGMKAVIYFDDISAGPGAGTASGDDKTLNDESVRTLIEIFKDPYWIMAK